MPEAHFDIHKKKRTHPKSREKTFLDYLGIEEQNLLTSFVNFPQEGLRQILMWPKTAARLNARNSAQG